MGSLYSLSVLVLLLFTSVGQICGSEVKNGNNHLSVEGNMKSDDLPTDRQLLDYDTKDQDVFSKNHDKERLFEAELEALLRAILENGLPELNIPPLDPLVYEDNVAIGETDMPGMMTVKHFELGDFEVRGLSKFIKHSLAFQLLQLTIAFNFTFPIEVKANHSDFNIIVGDLLPFNGGGPANLRTDLRVEASIVLGRTPEGFIRFDALSGDIFFDTLQVAFSSLMGVTGGKETDIFNRLLGEITPELIDLMKPYMIDGILESLLTSINELLFTVKITYTDIINCLSGDENCPFDLP